MLKDVWQGNFSAFSYILFVSWALCYKKCLHKLWSICTPIWLYILLYLLNGEITNSLWTGVSSTQAFITDHERALDELVGNNVENSRKFDACLNTMATRIATVFASLKVRIVHILFDNRRLKFYIVHKTDFLSEALLE